MICSRETLLQCGMNATISVGLRIGIQNKIKVKLEAKGGNRVSSNIHDRIVPRCLSRFQVSGMISLLLVGTESYQTAFRYTNIGMSLLYLRGYLAILVIVADRHHSWGISFHMHLVRTFQHYKGYQNCLCCFGNLLVSSDQQLESGVLMSSTEILLHSLWLLGRELSV